jgi:hypothetical protein
MDGLGHGGWAMKIVNRKTRKAIRKSVKKVVKKHGAKIAAGLAGTIASALATLASTDAAGTKGRRTNLSEISKKVTDMISGDGKKRKHAASVHKLEKSGKRGKKRAALTEPAERAL